MINNLTFENMEVIFGMHSNTGGTKCPRTKTTPAGVGYPKGPQATPLVLLCTPRRGIAVLEVIMARQKFHPFIHGCLIYSNRSKAVRLTDNDVTLLITFKRFPEDIQKRIIQFIWWLEQSKEAKWHAVNTGWIDEKDEILDPDDC